MTGAEACFEKYGDKWYVKDTKSDGHSATASWINYLSDGRSWIPYRHGSCVNKSGAGKWGLCNKDYYEDSTTNRRAVTAAASSSRRASTTPRTAPGTAARSRRTCSTTSDPGIGPGPSGRGRCRPGNRAERPAPHSPRIGFACTGPLSDADRPPSLDGSGGPTRRRAPQGGRTEDPKSPLSTVDEQRLLYGDLRRSS
jgi:hypothetical protein